MTGESFGTGISDKEMLKEINTAIQMIAVGGQSYRIGTRQVTRADLRELYRIRTDLEVRISHETKSSLMDDTYTAVFEGR